MLLISILILCNVRFDLMVALGERSESRLALHAHCPELWSFVACEPTLWARVHMGTCMCVAPGRAEKCTADNKESHLFPAEGQWIWSEE